MADKDEIIRKLKEALQPFADLLIHPEDWPDAEVEVKVKINDISQAKLAIEEADEAP